MVMGNALTLGMGKIFGNTVSEVTRGPSSG